MTLKERLGAFAKGELTWAQMEGFSAGKAGLISKTACELARVGRLEDARVLLEGLVAINPKDAGARAALGTVYQKLARVPEALAAYDAVIGSGIASPVALANRGELRLRAGDVRGLEDLRGAVAVDAEGKTPSARRAAVLLKALAEPPLPAAPLPEDG